MRNMGSLEDWFGAQGCPSARSAPGYTTRLLVCACGHHALGGVVCTDGAARAVKDFGAALSWYASAGRTGPLTFNLVSAEADDIARCEHAAAAIQLLGVDGVVVLVNGRAGDWRTPDDLVPPAWVSALAKMPRDVPPGARVVEQGARALGFRWQRTVTGSEWSGRLQGLEICKLGDEDRVFRFGVGKPGKVNEETGERNTSPARDLCISILEKHASRFGQLEDGILEVPTADHVRASEVVEALARGGLANECSPEHRLEARVNQGLHPLEVDGSPLALVFPERPFQFPTVWWKGGNARYVDVLMRQGRVPWVIELKVDINQGEYYRDGIVQAALYQRYVHRAKGLRGWFEDALDLDHTACRAALVIPQLRNLQAEALERDHRALAAKLGVTLVPAALTRKALAALEW